MSMQKPEVLNSDTLTARVLEQKVWRRCNERNQHFMGAIVGREGSGKSYTALKIGESVDPSFSADRIMFDPAAFLRRLRDWKENGETQGKAVVADEAGVGLGVRTWHNEDQIKFNQVLQVIRDENMAIIFTLPRLSELDSQARGRLHAFLEMTGVDEERGYAEAKWKNIDPTRDETDELYKKYPRMRVDGRVQKVTRLAFTPPSDDLVEEYEERKNAFQQELYGDALSSMDESDDDAGDSLEEQAAKIANNGMAELVSRHGHTDQPYINADLLRAKHDLSHRDAKAVKSLLEQQFSDEELEDLA